MNKTILIAGITGQDGYYLSKKYFKKGFKIIGLSRKSIKKLDFSNSVIKTNYNEIGLIKIIKKYRPKIIFNLAAESNPSLSWNNALKKQKSITTININFINAILKTNRTIKYFHASSSEIFGISDKKKDENTNFAPNNPYGCFKLSAHLIVKLFREKYNLFLVNGILFNHESFRKNKKFLSSTIVDSCKKILDNKEKKLVLDDPYPIRDFAHAEDVIDAIYLIMNLKKPQDFIISGGNIMSVRELAEKIFQKFKIDKNKIKYRNHKRKNDVKVGNTSKLRRLTGWKPKFYKDSFISKISNDE